eukprot:SAG22_NODE_789_length_7224_cov_2.663953_8_plen_113_part_00
MLALLACHRPAGTDLPTARPHHREAYDERKGKKYFYNRATQETKWVQPTQSEAVENFLQRHAMTPTAGMDVEGVEYDRGLPAVSQQAQAAGAGRLGNFRRAASSRFSDAKQS